MILIIPEGTEFVDRKLVDEYKDTVESVYFPDSVSHICISAFRDCPKLKEVIFPKNLETIERSAFRNCESLTKITFTGESLKAIESEAFFCCEKLDNISLPDSLDYIGRWAFCRTALSNDKRNYENGNLYIGKYLVASYNPYECMIKDGTTLVANGAICPEIAIIRIPKTLKAQTKREYLGFEFLRLEEIHIEDLNTYIENGFNSVYYFNGAEDKGYKLYLNGTLLEHLEIDGIQEIPTQCFSHCSSIKSVKIGEGITHIGYKAFTECNNLESISLPKSLIDIEFETFAGCSKLKDISIKNCSRIEISAFGGIAATTEKKAYKAFAINSEGNITCRGIVFQEGTWARKIEEPLVLCRKGYHYCENLYNVFNYYHGIIDVNIAIYECETGEQNITAEGIDKWATETIKPVKRLYKEDIIKLLNTYN